MKKKYKKEEILDRERKILKETLDIVIQENTELKKSLSEIQSSVTENKIQLKEKIDSITDKNTAVEMLSNQIEQLKQKFYEFQLKQKMQSLLNNNISEDIINSKGNETNNNNNISNQLMHIKVEEEKNIKEKEKQMKTVEDKIEKQKHFLDKQREIRNEIINLKRDVNFLKEKINEQKNKFILYQYNCDIQNYFKANDLNNIKKFLNKKQKDNLLKNNFIYKIDLDLLSTQRRNEIINIREKNKTNKNGINDIKRLSLSNNKFNDNIYNIIQYTINPNFLYENQANNNLESFEPINIDNHTSRNIPKQKKIHSYVDELLKGSFVL